MSDNKEIFNHFDKIFTSNQPKNEIVCVVDCSESMQSIKDDAEGGLNSFIEEQRKVGDANFTLVEFKDCSSGRVKRSIIRGS